MILLRPTRRWHALLSAGVLGAIFAQTAAVANAASELSGYVYIDRNNDGNLAFSTDPNPEWVIPGVEIKLFSISGGIEALKSTVLTDSVGRFEFNSLTPGTYSIRETQPANYIDGIETVGTLKSIVGPPDPSASDAGTASNNDFRDIIVADNVKGEGYLFGEMGIASLYVSKRFIIGELSGSGGGGLGFAPPPVPEPTGVVLAALAFGGAALRRRSKNAKHASASARG